MHRGYIKLWRKYQENEFWKEVREFSKFEAWLDILTQVQHSHKPQKIVLGMNVIIVERGQSIKSLNTWASRWNWSKSKVSRFFTLLKKQNMILTESVSKSTRLTVINFDTYNESRNDDETMVKRCRNDDETMVTYRQECEEINNVKNVNKKDIYDDFIDFFNSEINTKYRGESKSKRQFAARIKEGFSFDDFKTAILAAKNNPFLMGKNDSGKRFLTPEYITRSDKLDEYLNQSGNGNNGNNNKMPVKYTGSQFSDEINNHPLVLDGTISPEGAELRRRMEEMKQDMYANE